MSLLLVSSLDSREEKLLLNLMDTLALLLPTLVKKGITSDDLINHLAEALQEGDKMSLSFYVCGISLISLAIAGFVWSSVAFIAVPIPILAYKAQENKFRASPWQRYMALIEKGTYGLARAWFKEDIPSPIIKLQLAKIGAKILTDHLEVQLKKQMQEAFEPLGLPM